VLLKVKYCAICGTDVHGFLFPIFDSYERHGGAV
jgi:threonine dehydrogenase-like Zn-dependent dehydrogenase